VALFLKARRSGDSSHRSVTAGLTANERAVADVFQDAVTALSTASSSNAIRDAIRSGSISGTVDAFPWDLFSSRVATLSSVFADELIEAGATLAPDGTEALLRTAGFLPTGSSVGLEFNRADPRAIAWAESQAAVLVQEVTTSTRLAIRGVIVESLTAGLSVADTRRRLQESVGLTFKGAESVGRLRARVFEEALRNGKSISEANSLADAQSDRYRARLVKSRAQTIARTEILRSTNNGRYLGWTQAIEAGLVSPESTKKWSATVASINGEVCDFCKPMNGEIIKWDEVFSNGVLMPPAHPNCRCTATLERPQPTKRKEGVPQGKDLSTPAPKPVGVLQSPVPAKPLPLPDEDELDQMPYRLKNANDIKVLDSELKGILRNLGEDDAMRLEDRLISGFQIQAQKPVRIQVSEQNFKKILADGRMRTLAETKRSTAGGTSDTYMRGREIYEAGRMGVPATAKASDRPIYGHLHDYLDPNDSKSASAYGDMTLVLKNRVKGRTTMTAGDTLNGSLPVVSMSKAAASELEIDDLYWASNYRVRQELEKGAKAEGQGSPPDPMIVDPTKWNVEYWEVQVHGGVSVADIDRIQIGDWNWSRYSLASQKGIIESGIKIEIFDEYGQIRRTLN
jgi:SPP1 gp7 family putative phage head morphogenesis protein